MTARASVLRIALVLFALCLPGLVSAAGRWTVFIRPSGWVDALADADTVWLASSDAGLWRYQRGSGGFGTLYREPGGLASNLLTSLARDASGRLWVGTDDAGVAVRAADGASWTLVNAFDGLPSTRITCLTPAGDSVWIGTDAGLALWNGREISGAIPDGVNPSPFVSNVIRGIQPLGDDVLVGTASGMYRAQLSDGLRTWTPANTGLVDIAITGMAGDGRDVFALSATATHRWNPVTGAWGVAGGNGNARRLRADHGRVCTVAPQGLYVWRPGPDVWAQAVGAPGSGNDTPGLVEPTVSSDSVIVAVDAGGVRLSSEGYAPHEFPGPAGNEVNNLVAHDGAVYVGTQGFGFSRYRDGVWRSWGPAQSCGSCTSPADTAFINSSFVLGLMVDRVGVKWVGCWGAALARMDDSGDAPVIWNQAVNDGQGSNPVLHTFTWAGASGPNDTRWFGLDTGSAGVLIPNGIDVYQADGTFVRSYVPGYPGLRTGQVRALEFDRRGRLWVGYAQQGISFSDQISSSFPNPDDLQLEAMLRTETLNIFAIRAVDNVAWVLAEDGLRRLAISADTLATDVPYAPNAGAMAPSGAVHPLEVIPGAGVWVGTSGGLRHYTDPVASASSIGAFEDFTTANSPLPNDEVRSVHYDSTAKALWIATRAGIARYEPDYVAPPPPSVARLELRPYPNPITITGIGFGLRLRSDRVLESGVILDLGGRVVRRLRAVAPGAIAWDGRDAGGAHVPPGVYFLRAVAGGVEGTARLVVVR